MVTDNHFRWDFIGLSTDEKPTPATSSKVVDGSTFYCSDNSKLYVWCKTQWYEKTVSGGGGGTTYTAGDGIDITEDVISVDTTTIQPKLTAGENITIEDNVISASGGSSISVEQSIGNSTTNVMSQDATTKMIYNDTNRREIKITGDASSTTSKIAIGSSNIDGSYGIAIGWGGGAGSSSTHQGCISIGYGAYPNGPKAYGNNSVAIGAGSYTNAQGVFAIGGNSGFTGGYSNSAYRLLTGVYDGQNSHDAATVGQINATIDAINAALSTNIPHIGA